MGEARLMADQQLLNLYLTLSPKERSVRFGSTAHCAELVGVSQPTILLWIDSGMIHAVSIGKKYQVDLASVVEFLKTKTEPQ